MNASQGMTVARRLSLGFGLIILILVGMVVITLSGVSGINTQIYEIVKVNSIQSRLANQMVDAAQEMRVQYRQIILDDDVAKEKTTNERYKKARENFLKAEGDLNPNVSQTV